MHYTWKESQVFLVVKSVEEIKTEEHFVSTTVIRIYLEIIKTNEDIVEETIVDLKKSLNKRYFKSQKSLKKISNSQKVSTIKEADSRT